MTQEEPPEQNPELSVVAESIPRPSTRHGRRVAHGMTIRTQYVERTGRELHRPSEQGRRVLIEIRTPFAQPDTPRFPSRDREVHREIWGSRYLVVPCGAEGRDRTGNIPQHWPTRTIAALLHPLSTQHVDQMEKMVERIARAPSRAGPSPRLECRKWISYL